MTHPYTPQPDYLLPHVKLAELTFREFEILLLIAADQENEAIAERTKLASRTVINMRSRMGEKLLLKGRNKLGQFARQNRNSITYWFLVFYPGRAMV